MTTISQVNQPSANIRIILAHTGHVWVVPVFPQTTLLQILEHIDMDPDLFNNNPQFADPLVFVNEGGTTMPSLDRNMLDYNNWYVEHGYIPSLYIKNRSLVINDHGW